MEEFYVIGDFKDRRDVESFTPGVKDMASVLLAIEILEKHEKDAEFCKSRQDAMVKESKAGSTAAQEEALRRIEYDKLERAEREEAKERKRKMMEARRMEDPEDLLRAAEEHAAGNKDL